MEEITYFEEFLCDLLHHSLVLFRQLRFSMECGSNFKVSAFVSESNTTFHERLGPPCPSKLAHATKPGSDFLLGGLDEP